MKIIYYIIILLLAGCGGNNSEPVITGVSTPAISNFTINPTSKKLNSGYAWDCIDCFWPDYGCANTTSMTFNFHIADDLGDIETITYSWSGSWTGTSWTPSGTRTAPYGKTLAANQDISYSISSSYTDPGLIGPDNGSGSINCTSEIRTSTITIYVTDKDGNQSNSMTQIFTVHP